MNYTPEQSKMMFSFAEKTLDQALLGVDREDLPYIQTYSGVKFRHMWPLPEDVRLEDIAHGLSLLCRFGGQIKKFYSVAEHAVRVSYICDPEDAFEGLHHDDAEGLGCVDVLRPIKRAPGMEVYRMYENLTISAINQKFGLRPEPESVKLADRIMLETEARDLFPSKNQWKGEFAKPLKEKIIPWTSAKAEKMYLKRHHELLRGR